jgi:CubicO group peptidase (beta-lactamase class C family)
MIRLLLFFSLTFLLACDNASVAPAETKIDSQPVQAEDKPAPPPAPPGFHEAMETYKPLGKIDGGDTTAKTKSDIIKGNFSDSLTYVKSKNSYAFIIWKDGAIIHETYFAPHTADLRPDSASMHKTVAALAIGAAIDKGFIKSVDDSAGTYIQEWAGEPRGKITIRNLLEMNSGLEPLSTEGGMGSPSMTFWMRGDQARSMMMDMQLKHEPGRVFNYANVNTQILGHILEQATGQPYHSFLSENIWQPLGADDAYVWNNEPEGFPRTYTALMAKARDWLKVGLLIKDQGQFNGQQIVSKGYMADMISPSGPNSNYGFQTWLGTEFEPQRFYSESKAGFAALASEPFTADDIIYLDGFGGQRVYISPSNNLVIVRTGDPAFDWDDSYLPNMVLKELSEN